jgi:hypothetical protein
MNDLEIPEGLYLSYIKQSATYITTFTVNAGKVDEHEYDALNIDLPDLLDAIAAKGLPVACPSCGVLSSLTVPLKAPLDWEVSTTHRNECSVLAADLERRAPTLGEHPEWTERRARRVTGGDLP